MPAPWLCLEPDSINTPTLEDYDKNRELSLYNFKTCRVILVIGLHKIAYVLIPSNNGRLLYIGTSNLTSAQINEIFNRVEKDYRPFNINITSDSTKYWSAPAKQRKPVIFKLHLIGMELSGKQIYQTFSS